MGENLGFKFLGSYRASKARHILTQLENSGISFKLDLKPVSSGDGVFTEIPETVRIYVSENDWRNACSLLGLETLDEVEAGSDELIGIAVTEPSKETIESGMVLNVGERYKCNDPSTFEIWQGIEEMERQSADFLLLGPDRYNYIQCAGNSIEGFLLEYQAGSSDDHWQAIQHRISPREVYAIFVSYLKREDEWKTSVSWEPMQV